MAVFNKPLKYNLNDLSTQTVKESNKLLVCKTNQNLKAFAQQRNKTQMQPAEWKKIFRNDMSDKALISKIYKECL